MALSKIQTAEMLDASNLGRRNLIINGDMRIAQRGTSATGIGVTPAYNTVDRWRFADSNNPTARFTETQSTDAPEGFGFSRKFEVTTEDGATSDNEMQYTDQFIEAQNLQHLKYGTSNAESITLSFYVKSSVASTMGVRFSHEDGGGNYGASYTINSANTWERKSITVPGNTATAINNDNGRGMSIRFGLNIGATYAGSNSTAWGNGNYFGAHTNTFVGTANATWQITGVQLEVGDTATDFEHRSYGEELRNCQRYFQIYPRTGGTLRWNVTYYNTQAYATDQLLPMRALPTVTDIATGTSTASGFNLYALDGDSMNSSTNEGNAPTLSSQGLPENCVIVANWTGITKPTGVANHPGGASYNGATPGIHCYSEL